MTPRVSVRLFPPQAARLDELAEARGVTRSALLRTLILEATMPADAQAIPDRDELLTLLGAAARLGNVPAMRELLRHQRNEKPPAGLLGVVDELAARRAAT
jgi:hypothetical protein